MKLITVGLLLSLYIVAYTPTITAQELLPDSIPDGSNCTERQEFNPLASTCCQNDNPALFCPRQCNINGVCQCVNPITGEALSGGTFQMNSEVDCSALIIPDTEITTTMATTAVEPTTVTPTTVEPTTEATTTMATTTMVSTTTTTTQGTTTEDPTIATTEDDDEEESSESGSTGSTRGSSTTRSTTGTTTTGTTGTTRSEESSRSRSRSRSRCPRVRNLIRRGCIEECLVEDARGCPACDMECVALVPTGRPPMVQCNCAANQVCLRAGRFGIATCFDRPTVGERCDRVEFTSMTNEDDSSDSSKSRSRRSASNSTPRSRVRGARDRRVIGNLGEATIACQDGLVCVEVDEERSECQLPNMDGPCTIANEQGGMAECAPDGSFNPLQCQPEPDDDNLRCVCVFTNSGTPIAGTETVVSDRDDAPDCENFIGCTNTIGGQTFNVIHGDFFVNNTSCQRCLCSNGQAVDCEPAVCTSLQASPSSTCQYNGQSYNHGDSFEVDCNICSCNYGLFSCTHQECASAQAMDKCQQCMKLPANHLCGVNGITYPSSCAAAFCGGLAPFQTFSSPCANLDVCRIYPCLEDEICIKKGGATCLDADGCSPDDLRLCVNPNNLVCNDVAQPEATSQPPTTDVQVCSTNGQTYSSICELLQDTGNEGVAYAGECGREACSGGQVCGSDGVTYENVCVLRAQSANARVDYYGKCNTTCDRVISAGRCIYDESNCLHLVRSEEGCCPQCGGIISIAIDLAGLRNYVRINPSVRTLDDFVQLLVDSGFVSESTIARCSLESSITISRNLELIFNARTEDDAVFCSNETECIAKAINDPSTICNNNVKIHFVPEILQFASAAVTAPNVINEIVSNINGAGAGNSALVMLPNLFLMLLSSAVLLFH